MLKGCKKQVIVLNGTGSDIFEKAVFFLKNDQQESKWGGTAMLLEANRIIEKNNFPKKTEKLRHPYHLNRSRALFFALGMIVACVIILSILLLS